MPRPNGSVALSLDPNRIRVVRRNSHRCVRVADGVVLGYGDAESMSRLLDALGTTGYDVELNRAA